METSQFLGAKVSVQRGTWTMVSGENLIPISQVDMSKSSVNLLASIFVTSGSSSSGGTITLALEDNNGNGLSTQLRLGIGSTYMYGRAISWEVITAL
jgi:hypothetical protein